jgi:predicted amidohydrolase YtcJ
MSFRVGALVAIAFFAGIFVLFQIATRPPEAPAHHIFFNGVVLTMSEREPQVEAVSIRGGRIERLGSAEQILALATDQTEMTDLRGRTLMPGFVDAHGHFPGSGWTLFSTDLNSPPIGTVNN